MKIEPTKTVCIEGVSLDGGVGMGWVSQIAEGIFLAQYEYTSPYGEGDHFHAAHFTTEEEATDEVTSCLRDDQIPRVEISGDC